MRRLEFGTTGIPVFCQVPEESLRTPSPESPRQKLNRSMFLLSKTVGLPRSITPSLPMV